MTVGSVSWIAELASQERERRKKHQIVREGAGEFRQALSEQINSDLQAYSREFPEEAQYIQIGSELGPSTITRLRDHESEYGGDPCIVTFSIEVTEMVVECNFSLHPNLGRSFRIVLSADGRLALADASIADLSRYLLTPVLFDKLFPGGAPDHSEND